VRVRDFFFYTWVEVVDRWIGSAFLLYLDIGDAVPKCGLQMTVRNPRN
jgi:hypothetical protein